MISIKRSYVCFEQFWQILMKTLILYQLACPQWRLLVPQLRSYDNKTKRLFFCVFFYVH